MSHMLIQPVSSADLESSETAIGEKGIGRMLIESIEKIAIKRSCNYIML